VFAAIEKWQATALVLAVIVALVVLAIASSAPADLVVGALAGVPGLVLGAGAVAHGVRQGARSTADAVELERAEAHQRS
jgi:hypothetical protein